ncbi:MAG: peptidylprolyl isomerase, partial [Bacteroidales bacterium]|nr:peptidylprolyl isomerase [Bacteroidales bacterium]
ENERNDTIKAILIKAVIKAEDEEAWPLVEYLLKSDADYRLKVNILNSLQSIPWNKVNKMVYDFAIGDHPALSVAAAEAIQKFAVYTDLSVHLKAIKKAVSWRSRALLLAKGLELVNGKKALTKKIEKEVFGYYADAPTATEKGWLLKALASAPAQYKFVEEQLLQASEPVLATNAIETLTLMHKSENFGMAKEGFLDKGIDLDAEFLRIFKRAIQSGDVAAVTLACGVLRNPKLNYKEMITDTEFIKSALDNAQDPDEVEARNELVLTLAYFLDKKVPALPPIAYNHPINWERVKNIKPKQQIAIITKKGEIIVQLNVNWCPGTVGAFMELIEAGAFNNKIIHRVVPNFVVQDGCPRGDGWGGPSFTIRSEFTPAPFVEGSLGMASAGKDTEGSQWYITHSATPHLDAKYTNFGYVVAGMDVVHLLEVGDEIVKIQVIR